MSFSREPAPAVDPAPASPIPDVIRLIKQSFDELQNTLIEREKTLVRERDELKKQIDSLEYTQGYTELEKCDLEEKLKKSWRRCEELSEMIVQMKEKFEKSRGGKLDLGVGEKVVRKCEEIDERVAKIGLDKTIEALKAKEIEADGIVQELKRKSFEAVLAIDKLRAKRMSFDKAAASNATITIEDSEGEEPEVRARRLPDCSAKHTKGSISFKAKKLRSSVSAKSKVVSRSDERKVATTASLMHIYSTIDKASSSKDTSKTGQRGDKGKGKLNETECAPLRPSVVRRILLSGEKTKQKHEKGVIIKDTQGQDGVPKGKRAALTSRTTHGLERGKQVAEAIDSGSDMPQPTLVDKPKVVQSEEQLRPIDKRKAKRMKYKKLVDVHPRLSTRSTPRCLYDAVRKMNSTQKQAVREMGFGHVLNLNVRTLPGRLAYWVVNNFNSKSCDLTLHNGRTLTVTEEDVHRVLGFPNGHRKIVPLNGNETTELYEQWKALFGGGEIWMHKLAGAMLRCRDGGSWFKRHFMILVCTSLIESHASGSVVPYIMRCLENLDDIQKWNWAEYVMNSLVENKLTWAKSKSKMFVGPTLFLVVFYVDRLAVFNKTIDRTFPLHCNWTHESLKNREKEEIEGGFGVGQIREPIILPKEMNVQDKDMLASAEDVDSKDGRQLH